MREEYVNKSKENFKNRLYGLLCEKEKNGNWEDFLDGILLDLTRIPPIKHSYEYYVLFSRLSSCRYLSYKYFRKTIFECMRWVDRFDAL